jgi:hypothetical protein
VQQRGERVGVGRQVQRPAAAFHVVALGHAHEREVVQLVQRVVERVLLLIEEPLLPQLLVQPRGRRGEAAHCRGLRV